MGDLDYVKRLLKYIHPQKSGQGFCFTDLQSAFRLSKRLYQAVFGSCHGQAVHTSTIMLLIHAWSTSSVSMMLQKRVRCRRRCMQDSPNESSACKTPTERLACTMEERCY